MLFSSLLSLSSHCGSIPTGCVPLPLCRIRGIRSSHKSLGRGFYRLRFSPSSSPYLRHHNSSRLSLGDRDARQSLRRRRQLLLCENPNATRFQLALRSLRRHLSQLRNPVSVALLFGWCPWRCTFGSDSSAVSTILHISPRRSRWRCSSPFSECCRHCRGIRPTEPSGNSSTSLLWPSSWHSSPCRTLKPIRRWRWNAWNSKNVASPSTEEPPHSRITLSNGV